MSLFNCFHSTRPFVRTNVKRLYQDDKAAGDHRNRTWPFCTRSVKRMERCRLLSLPKELRLEIWTYVLTDPSIELTLAIQRKNTGLDTSVKTKFEVPRTAPINLHLLRTNQLIYDEAIPVLYRSVKFHPYDLEGIFPLFLETISPFAQSHIRFVKLSVFPSPGDDFYFHWALTCAQVAKLSACLRQVDIEGYWPLAENDKDLRRILNPLAKIKAEKKFDGANIEFQRLFKLSMDEATKRLESRSVIKKVPTAAHTTAELRRGYSKRMGYEASPLKRPRLQDFTFKDASTTELLFAPMEENANLDDLRGVNGIKKSETALERWELVNDGDEAVHLRKRTANILDDETWTDAASTIIVKDDDPDASKVSEDWELVSKPSSPA